MKERLVEIELSSAGIGTIRIGELQVENYTRAVTVRSRVGELSTVELDIMALGGGVRFSGAAYVGLPSHTEDLLADLGWTPPPGGDAVRFWTPMASSVVARLAAGATDELPADWSVVRVLRIPARALGQSGPDYHLAEIECRDAPAEVAGQVCTPTFRRYKGNGVTGGYVTIYEWGIPARENPAQKMELPYSTVDNSAKDSE